MPFKNNAANTKPELVKQPNKNNTRPNSIFTLLPRKEEHSVNWYVHRDQRIRNELGGLWGKGPEDKKNLDSYNDQQLIVARTNALFRALEKKGPTPVQELDWLNVKLDTSHGKCNRVKEGCVSRGFYHAHVSDKKISFEVIWECFEDKKLINIVAMGTHENFDFTQRGHDPEHGMKSAMRAAELANFRPDVAYDSQTYNNSIF